MTHLRQRVLFNSSSTVFNCCFSDGFAGGDTVIGNLLFGHCRETTEVGPINSWHRAPYIYDSGLVDDANGSSITPSLAEIAAGATPGYRAAPAGVGSVVSNYRRIAHNFLVGSYNVYDNIETDDASSRYLTYSNYLLYGKVVINSAMLHGNWNYNVGNVHAYPQQIGTGWGGGGQQTFVYNGTILMRDANDEWCNELLTQVLNNTIYTPGAAGSGTISRKDQGIVATHDTGDRGRLAGQCCAPACPAIPCPPGPPPPGRCSGGGNVLRVGVLQDAEVTAKASEVLAPYPRPYQDADVQQ